MINDDDHYYIRSIKDPKLHQNRAYRIGYWKIDKTTRFFGSTETTTTTDMTPARSGRVNWSHVFALSRNLSSSYLHTTRALLEQVGVYAHRPRSPRPPPCRGDFVMVLAGALWRQSTVRDQRLRSAHSGGFQKDGFDEDPNVGIWFFWVNTNWKVCL